VEFQRRAVDLGGQRVFLRELSAGGVELVDQVEGEFRQALALVGLSLCTAEGVPLFDNVEAALAHVRALPARTVREDLVPVAGELNGMDLDDARKN